MNTGLIAARYAEALSDYARLLGQEEEVYASSVTLLAKLKEVGASEPSANLESDNLQDVLSATVARCCEAMQRFLQIVIRNGRASYLLFILSTFGRRYRWEHGIARAHITTADEKWQPVLKQRVEEFLYANGWSKVDFSLDTDTSLMGGYVLQLRDQRVDASLATQLRKVSNELTDKNHRL